MDIIQPDPNRPWETFVNNSAKLASFIKEKEIIDPDGKAPGNSQDHLSGIYTTSYQLEFLTFKEILTHDEIKRFSNLSELLYDLYLKYTIKRSIFIWGMLNHHEVKEALNLYFEGKYDDDELFIEIYEIFPNFSLNKIYSFTFLILSEYLFIATQLINIFNNSQKYESIEDEGFWNFIYYFLKINENFRLDQALNELKKRKRSCLAGIKNIRYQLGKEDSDIAFLQQIVNLNRQNLDLNMEAFYLSRIVRLFK